MTTILIKKKDTAGAPAAGDLTNAAGGAEIAVNTATKRIYTKDSGGNVVEVGTNPTATTMNGNLTFVPDATYDIGATGATRPRDIFMSRNLTVGGTMTVAGGINFNGNVTVGDSSTDTLTINSTITSNLIFTDNTYDIGASGATRPRTGYFGTSVFTPLLDATNVEVSNIKALDGTAAITIANSTGAVTVSSAFSTQGNTTLGNAAADNVTVTGTVTSNLIFTDNTYDIGASGATRPRTLYLGTSLITPAITNSGLTSGRVTYAGTGGLLQDSANLTFSGQLLTITNTAAATPITGTFALFSDGNANMAARFDADAEAYVINTQSAKNQFYQAGTLVTLNAASTITTVNSGALIDFNAYNSSNGASNIFLGAIAGGTNAAANFVLGRRTGANSWAESLRVDTNGGLITTPAASGNTVFNENGVDADFRVESDTNTHMLFVDGGNNRVAIGAQQWGASTAPFQATNIAVTDTGGAHHFLIGNQDSGGTNLPSMIRGVNGTLHLGWGNDWTSATGGTMTQAVSVVGTSPSVVVNDDGGDIDFRVESDTNTHMLFVDAGNNSVTIGSSTAAPGNGLRVEGSIKGVTGFASQEMIAGYVASNYSGTRYWLLQNMSSVAGSIQAFNCQGDLVAASYSVWNNSRIFIRRTYAAYTLTGSITGIAASGVTVSIVDISYGGDRYIAIKFAGGDPGIAANLTGYLMDQMYVNGVPTFVNGTAGVTENVVVASYP